MSNVYVILADGMFYVGGKKWSTERPDAMEFNTFSRASDRRDHIEGNRSAFGVVFFTTILCVVELEKED